MTRSTHSGSEVGGDLDLLSRAEALMPREAGDARRGRAITIQRLQDARLRREIAEQLIEQPDVSRAFRDDLGALSRRLDALVGAGSAQHGLDERADELEQPVEVVRERVVRRRGWSLTRILLLGGLAYVAYKLWPYVTGYMHDKFSAVGQRKLEEGMGTDLLAAPPARAPGSTIETGQFGGSRPAGSVPASPPDHPS